MSGVRSLEVRRGNRWLALVVALFSALLAACSAGSSSQPKPASGLASTREAQQEFRALHARWLAATSGERLALEQPLRDFLRRHGDDQRAAFVRVNLARVLIERGQLGEARELIEPVRRGTAGSARDFARVVEAAILIREGKPQAALGLLLSLRGRVVDAHERAVFGEELVRAALAARRHSEAMRYLLEWVAYAAPEDRDAIQTQVLARIERIPAPTLEQALADFASEVEQGSEASQLSPARAWLGKAVRARLTAIALERRDGELARRLLDTAPPSLRRGDEGVLLSRIASSGPVQPRVTGRALGFALSLRDPTARRRSAAVVAGLSRALGLPAGNGAAGAIQLVTHDDVEAGGVEAALLALSGEGAAILVAGVDTESATRAAKYAEQARIPVILLSSPKQAPAPDGFVFLLGVDTLEQQQVLRAALSERGFTRFGLVGDGGTACSSAPAAAGQPRFPVDQWKRQRVEALILLGDAGCARDALAESAASGVRPVLALGVESGELFSDSEWPATRIALAAGRFPYRAWDSAPVELERWREQAGRPPGWFELLGRDAAVLAQAALQKLPLERVEDVRRVAELHKKAREGLAVAKAALWSTESNGLAGSRVLARRLTTVASDAAARENPATQGSSARPRLR